MLYCGFDLSSSFFRALILSAGFALLDHKFFRVEEEFLNPFLSNWIDSFKENPQEGCLYLFDEWQFTNSKYAHRLLLPINEPDKIYLAKHRKILDIIYFVQTWVSTEYELPLSNEVEYVLASFPRIFDLKEAKEPN